jgi:hypothetical protein
MEKHNLIGFGAVAAATVIASLMAAGISAKHAMERKAPSLLRGGPESASHGRPATAEVQSGPVPPPQVSADAGGFDETRFTGLPGGQEGWEPFDTIKETPNAAKTFENLIRLRMSQLEDQRRIAEAAKAGKLIIAWMQWRKADVGTSLTLDVTVENLNSQSFRDVRIACDLFDSAGALLHGSDHVAVIPQVHRAPFLTQIHDLDMGDVDIRTANVKCRVAE